ncbi:MAG: hypothetical protein JSS07_00700 [Proteobacteria bacterium]|nr:hypothetical protein [Pseudomonadota bacterium]
MNIWKLSPKHAKGYVRIRASSEARAREIAHATFAISKADKMIHNVNWSQILWQNQDQVDCELESDDLSNTEGILDIE